MWCRGGLVGENFLFVNSALNLKLIDLTCFCLKIISEKTARLFWQIVPVNSDNFGVFISQKQKVASAKAVRKSYFLDVGF